jgi:polysaccharide biosynthesis transport protein
MQSDSTEITVSLTDVLRFALTGLVPAIILAALAAFTAFTLTARQEPVYRAEAILLVARSGAATQFGLSPVTAPAIDLSAYRVAAASDPVMTEALRVLGVEQPSQAEILRLRGRTAAIAAADARDSSLLRIEARAETPSLAAARANAVSTALVAWDTQRASERFRRIVDALEQQVDALNEQIRLLQVMGTATTQIQIDGLVRLRTDAQQQLGYATALIASAEGLVTILQRADTTPRLIAPRPATSAGLAGLLAAVLAYVVLLVRWALTSRMRTVADVAATSGLPVLGEFPSSARDPVRLRESANYLRTSLLFATSDVHPKVFLVTSATAHEGKTTVAVQLAESLVRYGYRTLLVDADLRSPSLAVVYGIADRQVASTHHWLRAPHDDHHVLSISIATDQHLDVIPQARSVSDAPDLLGRSLPQVLEVWKGYDVIVIDSAPVLPVADSLAIAPHCSGTILVVDHRRLNRTRLLAAQELLARAGATVLGIVSNRVRTARGESFYGAAYGYGAEPAKAHLTTLKRRSVQRASRVQE